jgi:hypothetical protein
MDGYRLIAWLLSIGALMGVTIGCGCGCGSSSTTPTSATPTTTPTAAPMTTFTGTIAGSGNQSGTLVITVSATVLATSAVKAQDAATATAVLTLINGGGTFNLSGTFDTVSGALNLSGGRHRPTSAPRSPGPAASARAT